MIGFRHKRPCGLFFVLFFLFLDIVLVSAADAKTRIMPLGDSITLGSSSGVADRDFWVSYRKALYDKLWAAGYVVDDEIFVGTPTWISGESVADFDPDHEGHPGWRADEIVNGRIGSTEGKLDEWLIAEEPNIVLLHIGTNDVANGNEDWNEIEDILVVIDDYESASGKPVWVILSLIIDRSCDPYLPPCPKSAETTAFNNNVRDFVFFPRQAGGDKIILVDMQNGAGINYDRWDMGGDMWNDLHPFETGYSKMANVWFNALVDLFSQPANFTADSVIGPAPLTVNFADESLGPISSWEWDFGDDSQPSYEQNPTHTYQDPGIYTVSLTVTDPQGSDTETKTDFIITVKYFNDVVPGYWAEDYIHAIFDAGITTGCSQNPLKYCPYNPVTRAQMAAFLIRAVEGEPPADYCATGSPFSDVFPDTWPCKYIKRLSELEITQGCGADNYCPNDPVPRAQMAAFLVRAVEGEPPANYCDTGSPFSDVSPDTWPCRYIKRMLELGITKGCGAGNYCPKATVIRNQMAAFLARAYLGMD